MEREDIFKFTNSIILLSKLFVTIEDRFLKQKLHSKISDFVSAFVEQKSVHSSTSNVAQLGLRNISENVAQSSHIVQRSVNVAQYDSRDLVNSINNLIDYLEYLVHISKSNTTPLLVAQRNLLKFKLHILQQKKKGRPGADVDVPLSPVSKGPVSASQRKAKLGSGTTKERIFNYIKKTPDARARDIMTEFSALSGRTVKRSLKELTAEGFLKKISDGGAVYYLPSE